MTVNLDGSTVVLRFVWTAPATTAIYTLSLHDALPISRGRVDRQRRRALRLQQRGQPAGESPGWNLPGAPQRGQPIRRTRSEEHTSELQSQSNLVCRLRLEKKNAQLGHRSGEPSR